MLARLSNRREVVLGIVALHLGRRRSGIDPMLLNGICHEANHFVLFSILAFRGAMSSRGADRYHVRCSRSRNQPMTCDPQIRVPSFSHWHRCALINFDDTGTTSGLYVRRANSTTCRPIPDRSSHRNGAAKIMDPPIGNT